MMMKNLLCVLLIVGIAACTAGCTISSETTTPTVTPTPTETSPSPTLRPAASSDLPDVDYAAVPVLTNESGWLTTNASYVARIALRDEAARAMYLGGGEIEGVVFSCHPTPFGSSDNGCAPALRISNKTAIVDFLVDETAGRVTTTVTEIR